MVAAQRPLQVHEPIVRLLAVELHCGSGGLGFNCRVGEVVRSVIEGQITRKKHSDAKSEWKSLFLL